MPGNYSLVVTEANGNIIDASTRNAEHTNHITNATPAGIDDASASNGAMQTVKDPYLGDTIRLAGSLEEELQHIRYVLAEIVGNTYWYQGPTGPMMASIASSTDNAFVRFDGTGGNAIQSQNLVTGGDGYINSSSAGTTFSATAVADGNPWDLSGVSIGDIVAITGGGAYGIITTVSDVTDTLTCSGGWLPTGVAQPTDTDIAEVHSAEPPLTIEGKAYNPWIRLQPNETAGNAWDILVDNSTGDNLTYRYNGVTKAYLDTDGDFFLPGQTGANTALYVQAPGANDTQVRLGANSDTTLTEWILEHDESNDNLRFWHDTFLHSEFFNEGYTTLYGNPGSEARLTLQTSDGQDASIILTVDTATTDRDWKISHDYTDNDLDIFYEATLIAKFENAGGLYIHASAPATPNDQTLYEDSIIKAWATVSNVTNLLDDVNVSSIDDLGVGSVRCNFANVFANTAFACGTCAGSAGVLAYRNTFTAASVHIITEDSAVGTNLDRHFSVICVGNN